MVKFIVTWIIITWGAPPTTTDEFGRTDNVVYSTLMRHEKPMKKEFKKEKEAVDFYNKLLTEQRISKGALCNLRDDIDSVRLIRKK